MHIPDVQHNQNQIPTSPDQTLNNEASVPSVGSSAYSDKRDGILRNTCWRWRPALNEPICSVKPKRTKSKHLVQPLIIAPAQRDRVQQFNSRMNIEFAINVSRVASDGFNRYGQFACNEPTIVALYQIRKYLRLPRRQPSFQGGFATQFVTLPNVATVNAIGTETIPHPARKQRRNCRRCIDKLQHDVRIAPHENPGANSDCSTCADAARSEESGWQNSLISKKEPTERISVDSKNQAPL